jgi:succinyl-CoA synthetase beta subunit
MLLHEHQSKKLLGRCGMAVPLGFVYSGEGDLRQSLSSLTFPVMIKAQVLTGGRGKAGAVKTAQTMDEAFVVAAEILAMTVKTAQTHGQGLKVRSVLIEEARKPISELYVSCTIDRSNRAPVLVVSPNGGMDIEETAAKSPDDLLRLPFDPLRGLSDHQCRRVHYFLKAKDVALKETSAMLRGVVKTFFDNDATMVEINPMGVNDSGGFTAMDAKISLDDNALFRHGEWNEFAASGDKNPIELEAARFELNYIKIPGGSIGCMVNGAGLAMGTMDMIDLFGARPANFLDVGGSVSKEAITAAFGILVADPDVRAIFVNIFGGIVKCDLIAEGIVAARSKVDVQVPLIIRLEGTNVEHGWTLLKNSGIPCICEPDFTQAAKEVVRLAGG